MKNMKKNIIIILIVLLILTTFTALGAFTSTVSYNANMTMPDEIMQILGG